MMYASSIEFTYSGVGEECAYRTDIVNNHVNETTIPSPTWWLLYPTVMYMKKKKKINTMVDSVI